MSGLAYTNPYYSPYAQANLQYGVNMPAAIPDSSADGFQAASGLASLIPYVGPLISAGLNMAGTFYQNAKQEEFYNNYMSPQARMAQMKAAGINPAAAAQGIAGTPGASIAAAAPSSAFSDLGSQLGNSVNTVLTADAIKAGIKNTEADTAFKESLNVEKQTTNKYLDQMQQQTLDRLVSENRISRSTANMIAVDESYKPAVAYANYQQLFANLQKTQTEIDHLVSQTVLSYAEVYQAMANASLAEAQIKKVFSDIGLNNKMIERIAHEIGKIDAEKALLGGQFDEVKAKAASIEIQNKFQNDYYEIWQNTGFNWNSDIEKSIVGAYQNFQDEDGNRMLRGLQFYLTGVDKSRGMSDMYLTDFFRDMSLSLVGCLGLGAVSGGLRNRSNRGTKTTTNFDVDGVVTGGSVTSYGD